MRSSWSWCIASLRKQALHTMKLEIHIKIVLNMRYVRPFPRRPTERLTIDKRSTNNQLLGVRGMKSNKLRDAVILALAVGLGATGAAQAQTAPAQTPTTNDGTKTLDRMTVTGSRLRQVETESAQPVTIVTREDIEKQGFQSVADILQNISATGTPPISRASPLSAGEAAGGTYISLRNLGAPRTLILINGKRLGITNGGLADVSSIPASTVERIEVLKDGASSIYGSDAIAGVINIITRSGFNGATVSAYAGTYDQGDGDIRRADFVIGFNEDRISVTVGGEVRQEEAVRAKDRNFSAFPRSHLHPTDNFTTLGQFGGFTTTATTPVPGLPTGTRVVLRPGGDPRVAADFIRQDQNTGDCRAPSGATVTGGCVPGSTLHKTNTLEQTDLRTPVNSAALFADISFDISDSVRWRTNVLFNNRDSTRQVAGFPLQAGSATPAAAMSPLSYFNPTTGTISNWFRRTFELPRTTDSNLKTYRISTGLEGSFDFGERYVDWDIGALYNTNRQRQVAFGNIDLPNLRKAVGPSFLNGQGQVQCGTAATPIPFADCVPFNPFLPLGVEGRGGLTNNALLQDFFFKPELAFGETTTKVYTANLASSLLTLPAGDIRFAAGLERREESGKFTPDPRSVAGVTTNLSSGPTRGGYKVDEAYVEVEIPVFADAPFAKELTFNLASRYSDYDTFGETTNNKISMKWRPIASVLVRASANDGFRAPTIADLFGGTTDTFSFYTDPCDVIYGSSLNNPTTRANCAAVLGPLANTFRQLGQGFVPVTAPNAQTPVAFKSGSNPALLPEESRSQTIGFVWSPEFITGFNFAVDWWKIRITETIVTDSPNAILNDCFINGIKSRCSPALFTRDPVLGFVNTANFGSRNAGFRKVEGFDVDMSYRWDAGRFGNFTVVSNSTYTARDYFLSTNDPRIPISSVGVAFSTATNFRIRSNLNVGWDLGNFGVSWIARHYSSMKEGCAYSIPTINDPHLECNEIRFAPTGNVTGTLSEPQRRRVTGSNTFNDVQVRWRAPWDATISVGANNVFERYGPVMYTQPSANVSYYGGFDIGRFIYMKYTQKFSL